MNKKPKAKYIKRSENIHNFMKNLKTCLSRVEILEKFKEGEGYPKTPFNQGITTNEKALNYLVEKEFIKKYYSKKGRIMFKSK